MICKLFYGRLNISRKGVDWVGVRFSEKTTFDAVAFGVFYDCLDLPITQGYQGIRAACPGIPGDDIKLKQGTCLSKVDVVMKFYLPSKFTGTSFAEHLHIVT